MQEYYHVYCHDSGRTHLYTHGCGNQMVTVCRTRLGANRSLVPVDFDSEHKASIPSMFHTNTLLVYIRRCKRPWRRFATALGSSSLIICITLSLYIKVVNVYVLMFCAVVQTSPASYHQVLVP